MEAVRLEALRAHFPRVRAAGPASQSWNRTQNVQFKYVSLCQADLAMTRLPWGFPKAFFGGGYVAECQAIGDTYAKNP